MRILSSTSFLLLALLLAFDYALATIKPLRLLNETGLTSINQNFLVSKLPEILRSQQDKDALLLGSSIVLVPAVRCDDKLNKIKTRYDRWYYRNYIDEYVKANFLEKLLSEKLGQKITVWNAAVAASVISDDYLIAKKYLASGKRPKTIILCVAPREFLDNQRSQIDKTATYSILADFSSLPDLIAQKAEFSRIVDSALGMTWDYYRNRRDYKDFLRAWTSRTTGNPLDIADGQKRQPQQANAPKPMDDAGVLDKVQANYEQPPNTLSDLAGYERMYLPVNETQWKNQTEYFHKLLKLASEHNIPIVVVDVPVAKENYAILPASTHRMYDRFLESATREHGARLIKAAEPQPFCTATDFEDSAHMNESGGDKLFKAIADGISQDKQLSLVLSGKKNAAIASRN